MSTTCTQYDFSVCTYTLVELPVPAEGHAGLVPTIHPVNVVPLNLLDLVHSYIACKGDLQSHRQGEQPCKSIIAEVTWLYNYLSKYLEELFMVMGVLPTLSHLLSLIPPSLPHTSLPPSLTPPSHLPLSLPLSLPHTSLAPSTKTVDTVRSYLSDRSSPPWSATS